MKETLGGTLLDDNEKIRSDFDEIVAREFGGSALRYVDTPQAEPFGVDLMEPLDGKTGAAEAFATIKYTDTTDPYTNEPKKVVDGTD